MICEYCGTALPSAAMFCGECGRAVASTAAPKAWPAVPSSSASIDSRWPAFVAEHEVDRMMALSNQPGLVEVDLLASRPIGIPVAAPEIVEPSAARPARESAQVRIPELLGGAELARAEHAPHIEHCQQCGAELAPSDIFCGECGFVRRPAESSGVPPHDPGTYDPSPWGLPPASEEAGAGSGLEPESGGELEPRAAAPETPVASTEAEHPADVGDAEETRIVDRLSRGDKFILQFSTGENVTVSGTGLLGRNPVGEPGEYFDSRVTIVDPGRSVSKTHLEFGQDDGHFFICDRFSANGTVLREPDRPARRAEAGKRYRLVRGTRVDIGEQFFIVS